MHQDTPEETGLAAGAALIRRLAATVPDTPGVYRMLDERGDALYVGKARSLRRRVNSYTNVSRLPGRLQRMVALTRSMEFVHTHTEVEALLLEFNLIKKLKPRYNVLLRDDKSFSYIMIARDHDFPVLTRHRGARVREGEYYGPFASSGAVHHTVAYLQRAFMLRNCSDTVFAQRTRPCLQYHIKRCTAPCVALVSQEAYCRQVDDASDYLSGKSKAVQARLAKQMQEASDGMDFEEAAKLRDRIRALAAIQVKQDINIEGIGDADVIGFFREGGQCCVQVFFFRGGQNFGNRAYFPRHAAEDPDDEILFAFMGQFYENKAAPDEIIVGCALPEKELLEEALNLRRGGLKRVTITRPQRGARRRVLDFAVANARTALAHERERNAGEAKLLEGVAAALGLEEPPERIEVYDNSHISGTNMTGAMIVAGPEGLRKNAYRKFNIRAAEAADDYGMMSEVMQRRFGKALKENRGPDTAEWPDLVIVDGGVGQHNAVMEVLESLGAADDVVVLAIAKGPDRNAGRETFFMKGRGLFTLPPNDPVMHYLQRLRDEVHRFAIGAHRARRVKALSGSLLDDVPGVGSARKKALLHHFGAAQDVARAGIKDLMAVDGISEAVAKRIYAHFHENG